MSRIFAALAIYNAFNNLLWAPSLTTVYKSSNSSWLVNLVQAKPLFCCDFLRIRSLIKLQAQWRLSEWTWWRRMCFMRRQSLDWKSGTLLARRGIGLSLRITLACQKWPASCSISLMKNLSIKPNTGFKNWPNAVVQNFQNCYWAISATCSLLRTWTKHSLS